MIGHAAKGTGSDKRPRAAALLAVLLSGKQEVVLMQISCLNTDQGDAVVNIKLDHGVSYGSGDPFSQRDPLGRLKARVI